jgi:hypothetical protein
MILKFAQTSPKFVQEAAKSTIMTLFGSLPSYALDAALITTNTKLANLLFQMQITGYMFKNAEYRMSLTKSLKGLPRLPSPSVMQTGNVSFNPLQVRTNSFYTQPDLSRAENSYGSCRRVLPCLGKSVC